MGRSVSYASGSVHKAYATFEGDSDDFDFEIEGFQSAMCKAFPSLESCDEWVGREDHAMAENSFAYFGISEYCGLVCMWVQPKDDDYATSTGLRDHWIDAIGAKFSKVAAKCFGQSLVSQGRFSNGEQIFAPVNGVQQGAMGLGFSSKEGWL